MQKAIIDEEQLDLHGSSLVPTVFLARDTRSSGKRLCDHARDAALAMKANVLDFSEMTTPQLHYAVRTYNRDGGKDACYTQTGYFDTYATAFKSLVGDSIKVSLQLMDRLDRFAWCMYA